MDIIITIPKSTKWEIYLEEIRKVEQEGEVMNFKVSSFPKKTKVGERCYIVHDGEVKGWMEIVGFEEKEFQCTITGRMLEGKFIVRGGEFYDFSKNPLSTTVKMKGFQGYRYYNSMEQQKIARLKTASERILANSKYGK